MLKQKEQIESVKIADLVLDKHIQMRASLNRSAICDYADAMEAGAVFPPIVVFYRFASKRYVADGYHRVLAAKKLGRKTITAEVRDGSRRDAMLYAAGANMDHGVRRTNEDKRKAVITLLKDQEWKKWADSEIARACGVTNSMVGKYREWMRPGKDSGDYDVRTYIDRKGRERTITVSRDDREIDQKLSGRKCPYCGGLMNQG